MSQVSKCDTDSPDSPRSMDIVNISTLSAELCCFSEAWTDCRQVGQGCCCWKCRLSRYWEGLQSECKIYCYLWCDANQMLVSATLVLSRVSLSRGHWTWTCVSFHLDSWYRDLSLFVLSTRSWYVPLALSSMLVLPWKECRTSQCEGRSLFSRKVLLWQRWYHMVNLYVRSVMCMCTFRCIYKHICVRMCICVYVYLWMYVYLCIFVYFYIWILVYLYIYIYIIYVYTFVDLHVCIFIFIYPYIYIFVYLFIYL